MNKAIFAGGCFWCVEHDFHEAEGIVSVVSGYTGGDAGSATYLQVASHQTLHREAVLVEYDPARTSYKKLVQFFIDHIDPTDPGGQFHDRGESYRTVIYYGNDEEKNIAEDVLAELDESHIYNKPHAVSIELAKAFYNAEESHQNYAKKNPSHYASYRQSSGREDFVNRTCAIREEKSLKWKD